MIFGLGPSGLFLTRQLHRAGHLVFGVGKNDDIGRYSKYLEKFYPSEDTEEIKMIVGELIKTKGTCKAYICSDQYLTMFLEEWPDIFDLIHFDEPGKRKLFFIANKERMMQSCKHIGVCFPKDYSNDTDSDIVFPVVIKPKIKRGSSIVPKIAIIKDNKSLIEYYRIAKKGDLDRKDLLIQQYIPGNNRYEYGYGGYFKNGKAVLDIVFLQLRQYPQGVSCYACEADNLDDVVSIKKLVEPFLKSTQYSGFLQFDIKKHPDSGSFYILDVNPRPWGSISILSPKCKTKSLFDKHFTPDDVKVAWRFPFKEIFSIKNKYNVSYHDIGAITPCNSIITVDLYEKDDPRPFFMQIPIALKKISKRIARRK